MSLIEEAMANGARKTAACRTIGVSIRTLQRWVDDSVILSDKRTIPRQTSPHNKLSEEECQSIITICNSPEFADLIPNQIVPVIADRGIYIASESTFYRVLKANHQLTNRTRSTPKGSHKKPRAQ